MPLDKTSETRTVTSTLELRDGDGDTPPKLVGYAATFGQEYDLGAFREVIDPSAFSRTLGTNPDVRLLVDHAGQPLARTSRMRTDGTFTPGTLTLSADPTGLRVEAGLDASDPDVQRLIPKLRRGDLDQMSFAFRVPSGGDSWSPDYGLRTLHNIELAGGDVSVVTYPANPTTTAALRSRDALTGTCALMETLARELRAGKVLSADTVARLQDMLSSLAVADAASDKVSAALDDAQSKLSDLLGVTDPDPTDDDAKQANSRPLGLALAMAKSLGIPA